MTVADVERYRPELLAHCYRMLGSVHEAEDAVQETLVRAWRGLDRFAGRASLKTWLYRIATNVSLTMLARRSSWRRASSQLTAEPSVGPPESERAGEVLWLEPFPDAALDQIPDDEPGPQARYETREAIALAFAAAIQYLPPRQRAALLLCDVLGWPAAETAEALETTVASVNSALQRARETLKTKLPDDDSAIGKALRGDRERRLLADYVQFWERGDIEGVVALLREDAIFAMPPRPEWYRGRTAIRGLLTWAWRETGFSEMRLVPTGANRQPAFALYGRSHPGETWEAHAIHVLTLDDEGIGAVTNFLDKALFSTFGMPLTLPGATTTR